MKKTGLHNYLFLCMAVFCLLFTACGQAEHTNPEGTGEPPVSVTETPQNEGISKPEVTTTESPEENRKDPVSMQQLPAYSGKAYVEIDGNQPGFTEQDKTKQSFEQYSELDSLGRCGVAYANVGEDLMPTEKRGSIGKVKPSGCIR